MAHAGLAVASGLSQGPDQASGFVNGPKSRNEWQGHGTGSFQIAAYFQIAKDKGLGTQGWVACGFRFFWGLSRVYVWLYSQSTQSMLVTIPNTPIILLAVAGSRKPSSGKDLKVVG